PASQQVADWETEPQVMTLTKEQIPLMDGDVIFYMVSNWGDTEGSAIQEEWTGHPLWQTLQAVQHGAVHPVNEEHWNLGGGIQAANRMLDDLYHFFLPDEPLTAPGAAGFPVTIRHKFGSTEIAEEPTRVVTLGYSEQDPVLALGVVPVAVRDWFGDQPYAVWPWAQDELGDATPEVLRMPFGELNFEAIAALQPDLIIATHSGITQEEYETLSQIAPVLAQPAEYPDFGVPWQEQTRLIGRALGREQRANELVSEVEAQIAAARAAHPEFEGATVAWAMPADGTDQFWVVGPNTPPLRFLAALGFQYPAEIAAVVGKLDSAQISSERLDLLDTDLLILRVSSPEERVAIEGNALYRQLAVAQEGRTIFFVGSDDPTYGALSFSTVLSLPYVLEELVPQLAEALGRR
ncbi:MAG TPA: ABC transporter substrate-binding protein, partial [Caldilineaceae bacterium]|nr:ABC transporter substrate-binding protein [Caldilineaceae bacterium]